VSVVPGILVAALLAGCGGGGGGASTGSLRVLVTLDSAAQAGASLLLTPGNVVATTGGDGSYTFTGLSAGTYSVSASLGGNAGSAAGISVAAGQTAQVTIPIGPPTGSIQITARQNSVPQAGVDLALSPGGLTGTTGGGGTYTFQHLPPGTYDILASADGVGGAISAVAVAVGQTTQETIDLNPATASLEVTVTFQGSPAAGAEVNLSPGDRSGTTGGDGKITFTNLAPGAYRVSAHRDVYSGFVNDVAVTSAGANAVTVALPADTGDGGISGTVKTPNGDRTANVVGATMELVGADATTTSTTYGSFFFPNVPPGTYTVRATKTLTGGAVVTGETAGVVVNAGRTTVNVTVLVTRSGQTGTISGHVQTAGATPISGVKVIAHVGSAGAASQQAFPSDITDGNGDYAIPSVPAGSCRVYASAPGYQTAISPSLTVVAGQTVTADLTMAAAEGALLPAPSDVFAQAITFPTAAGPSSPAYLAVRQELAERSLARSRGADPRSRRLEMLRARARTSSRALANSFIEVDVLWAGPTPSEAPELAGYRVYRATQPQGAYSMVIESENPLAFYGTDLSPELDVGVGYYYTVRSYSTTDFQSSPSTPVSATPLGQIALSAPADGAGGRPTTVTLSWQALTGAQTYWVFVYEQAPDVGVNPTVVQLVTAPETSYQLSSLQSGHRYYWVVIAVNNVDAYDATANSASEIWWFDTQ
jgi:uncharacterized protein (DUF2141 family)